MIVSCRIGFPDGIRRLLQREDACRPEHLNHQNKVMGGEFKIQNCILSHVLSCLCVQTGETAALALARIANGDARMVQSLVDKGADLTIADQHGVTALSLLDT